MINCSSYDSEKTWLSYFFGTVNARNTGTPTGTLVNFDQTPYGGGGERPRHQRLPVRAQRPAPAARSAG